MAEKSGTTEPTALHRVLTACETAKGKVAEGQGGPGGARAGALVGGAVVLDGAAPQLEIRGTGPEPPALTGLVVFDDAVGQDAAGRHGVYPAPAHHRPVSAELALAEVQRAGGGVDDAEEGDLPIAFLDGAKALDKGTQQVEQMLQLQPERREQLLATHKWESAKIREEMETLLLGKDRPPDKIVVWEDQAYCPLCGGLLVPVV